MITLAQPLLLLAQCDAWQAPDVAKNCEQLPRCSLPERRDATSPARGAFLFSPIQFRSLCEGGIQMAPDLSEAFRFYWLAANGGHCPSARRAALMLENGIGVAVDLEQAFRWYYRAAELDAVSVNQRLAPEH